LRRIAVLVVTALAALVADGIAAQPGGVPGPAAPSVAAPVLKWDHGGCYASWCETGWYASPAVADIDGDGHPEVIASAYSIVVLDGATGTLEWRVASGHDRSEPGGSNVGRTWPGVVIADVDGDGADEIVTAHGGGWVSVYEASGYFADGWPRHPTTSELRGLSVADLDADGTMEVVVTAAIGSHTNTWVLEHDGTTRSGWPQLTGSGGYAWGTYNDTSALADLDADGAFEVVVPSDVHYICAYEANGAHIPAAPVYGVKNWGEVGVWESYATELRGWGACNGTRAESYRANFADGPATVADLDGDGTLEVAATGRVYDCTGGETTRYTGLYLFNPDRSRFHRGPYDWTTVPIDLGAPLSLDYNVIESAMPNPVTADLDGDGELEVLFADFAGKVHALWLDGTEHGAWPFSVYSAGEGFFRYASEPVVVDLDGNGSAEILFTSWTSKNSGAVGRLHVLSAAGVVLHEVTLPAAVGSWTWNGALAAPTVADIDGDPDLEVVVNTAHSGFVAYDLPGTAAARVLWGTGRGSFRRSGTAPVVRLFADGFETGDLSRWSSWVSE
jgi:hypothetical protein